MKNITGSTKNWNCNIKNDSSNKNSEIKQVEIKVVPFDKIKVLNEKAEQLKKEFEQVYAEYQHRNLYNGINSIEETVRSLEQIETNMN